MRNCYAFDSFLRFVHERSGHFLAQIASQTPKTADRHANTYNRAVPSITGRHGR